MCKELMQLLINTGKELHLYLLLLPLTVISPAVAVILIMLPAHLQEQNYPIINISPPSLAL